MRPTVDGDRKGAHRPLFPASGLFLVTLLGYVWGIDTGCRTSSDLPCDRKVQEGQFSVFSKVLSLLLRTL
jgi:hypothetical protein